MTAEKNSIDSVNESLMRDAFAECNRTIMRIINQNRSHANYMDFNRLMLEIEKSQRLSGKLGGDHSDYLWDAR